MTLGPPGLSRLISASQDRSWGGEKGSDLRIYIQFRVGISYGVWENGVEHESNVFGLSTWMNRGVTYWERSSFDMFSWEMTTRLPKEIARGQRLDFRAVVIACPPLLFICRAWKHEHKWRHTHHTSNYLEL